MSLSRLPWTLTFVVAMLTAGCAAPLASSASEAAEITLRSYFAALHEGRYEEAVLLFGGAYDQLEANNPDLDPADRAGLLERWCRQNGGVCLPVQAVVAVTPSSEGAFSFVVRFANEDGSTLEIGPCCGEEDTGQRTREFAYTARPAAKGFVILELPPYVP